jgi:formate hydrogenlyase transcriptional activator
MEPVLNPGVYRKHLLQTGNTEKGAWMVAVSAQTDQSVAERYEALLRISNLIRARLESESLFDILAHELGQVVPFDAIAQFDESANKVNWYLGPACHDQGQRPCEDDCESLPAWVYRNQESVVLNTVDYDPRFPKSSEILREKGLKSVCALPLTTAHRRLGSLILGRSHANSFSPDEVRFCSLVVDQIALATDDVINFRASQNARERLQLLLDLTNRVVSNLNLRDVLREISAQIRRVMECDGVGIALACSRDGKLRLFALDFPDAPAPIEEGYEPEPDKNAAPVQVFRTGEALILSGAQIEGDRIAAMHGLGTLAHVPMTASQGILGVLTLGTFRADAFGEQDLPFLNQVARQVAIAIENARTFGEVSEEREKLTLEKLYLQDEIRSELKFEEIVGRSAALRRVLDQIQTVAPTDSTVLIYGETGSGKELIARALHNLSSRKSGSFVKLNCAAIPTGLLESELFGHEKGAFTGAIAQRIGRFELAHRGTIFLDEVGEIPLELQPKLLRVLQEREFERLGSTRTLRTDARLIAATNRDLQQLVSEQKFRSDLFYRLNVFPVRVPSLRERPEDIPLLVRHFVQQFSRSFGKTIDAIDSETMSALTRYPWPGNIRELQNVIERGVILTGGPVLRVNPDELNASNAMPPAATQSGDAPAAAKGGKDLRSALEETERQQILAALEKSNWVVAGPAGAATLLGLKRSTLQARMQKLGIRVSRVAG